MNGFMNTLAAGAAAATLAGAPEAAPAMPAPAAHAAGGEVVHYPSAVVNRNTKWDEIYAVINPRQIGWYAFARQGGKMVEQEAVYIRCEGGNTSEEYDIFYGKYPGHETLQNPSYKICVNGFLRQSEKNAARQVPFRVLGEAGS